MLNTFNSGLEEIREIFHKSGRLDDSNSKLDELTKLLAIELAAARCKEAGVPSLRELIDASNKGSSLVRRINMALGRAANAPIFLNGETDSLLGANPKLALSDTEEDNLLAKKLADLVAATFHDHLVNPKGRQTFEALNEAFGHFVRDNFRNNIEDAQYMTPPEVVDFMCRLAVAIGQSSGLFANGRAPTVCDPSCGVGSFLAHFYRVYSELSQGRSRPVLVGQDKVDRMARLARLNLLLYGFDEPAITRGNSLLPPSALDEFQGKCDVILTNPPFGARFNTSELAFHAQNYFPLLAKTISETDVVIDSESLFLDRYFGLLREGGIVLAVLPDAVLSASGMPEQLRHSLANRFQVLSLIELPAVTFAQAGTRTKTSILVAKKAPSSSLRRVVFGQALSLGFEVSSKKGVPYKKTEGANDLPMLLASVVEALGSNRRGVAIHSDQPSCVSGDVSLLDEEQWTPNHHSAARYRVLESMSRGSRKGSSRTLKLRELAVLPPPSKREAAGVNGSRCISVLHVGDFGSLNIREFMEYDPKYPGKKCRPGDVLFSKINPRIPRAIVVPDLGIPLTCSTEFEVLQAIEPFDPYEIMLQLLGLNAQAQVQSLTSGTSSSHNRIKTEQLLDVVLTFPMENSPQEAEYRANVKQFAAAHKRLIVAQRELYAAWKSVGA